jgi:hypothetical protein
MFGEAAVLATKLYGLAIFISFLVAGMIWLVVFTLEKIQKKPAPKPAPVEVVEGDEEPTVIRGTDPAANDVVVIAAAVAATIGSVRIVRIEDAGRGTGWRDAGRILQSASRSSRTQKRRT